MEPVEYEIELERTNGPADHTSAILPSLTKGQRLNVPGWIGVRGGHRGDQTHDRRAGQMETARQGTGDAPGGLDPD
jgi:hypothetical protein